MVIGNEVADVYDAVLKEGGFSGGGEVPDDYGKMITLVLLIKPFR